MAYHNEKDICRSIPLLLLSAAWSIIFFSIKFFSRKGLFGRAFALASPSTFGQAMSNE